MPIFNSILLMMIQVFQQKILITLSITGLVLGLLLSWQFTTNIPVEGNFPTDEITAREELLKSYLDEQSYLQSKIVSLRKEIEDFQSTLELQTEISNLEILESLKAKIGLTTISGPGLEIVLDDKTSENLIQASDLRDVINLLNAAKIDAVAINNQRVIAGSGITAIGTNILVNNSHLAPPFVISAAGDTEIMLQRLLNKNLLPSIYERSAKKMIVFEIYKKNLVNIPIYNSELRTNYLNLVEE